MNWQKIKKQDWAITAICALLMILGLLVVFSTTYNSKAAGGVGDFEKQLVFIIGGFIIYFVILSIDFSWFSNPSIVRLIYAVTILLLIYVKFFGTTIANTNRWINIGFFSFQPSEFAKLVIILVTAAMFANPETEPYLASLHSNKKSKRENIAQRFFSWLGKFNLKQNQLAYLKLLLFNALTIMPIIVLTLIQPSLGNAIISLLVWGITMLVLFPSQKRLFRLILLSGLFLTIFVNLVSITRVGNDLILGLINEPNWLIVISCVVAILIVTFFMRVKILHLALIALLSIGIVGGIIGGWNYIMTDYQKTRIDTFLAGPESDPTHTGYQVIQSKIAIGSGMLLGRGFLEGTQSSLNVLTQASTDFVFAAFAEQFGFFGSLIVLSLYAALIFRVIKAGIDAADNFAKYVALGVAVLLLLQVFINIGMNLGKLPVTGITLPLMSYGGSSISLVMISLGLVQSINTSRKSVDIADDLMLISQSLLVKEKL